LVVPEGFGKAVCRFVFVVAAEVRVAVEARRVMRTLRAMVVACSESGSSDCGVALMAAPGISLLLYIPTERRQAPTLHLRETKSNDFIRSSPKPP